MTTPSANTANRNASMSLTLEPDTSLDLFDIDENDFEYEHDYQDAEIDDSFSRNLQALQNNNFGYPPFAQHAQQVQQPVFNQQHFADPFQPVSRFNGLHHNAHILNGIPEGVEHHFLATQQPHTRKAYYDDVHSAHFNLYAPVPRVQNQYGQAIPQSYPAFVPVPQPAVLSYPPPAPLQSKITADRSYSSSSAKLDAYPLAEVAPTDCSVCLASNPSSLAVLQPCKHPLCSACLTSALNIVGEKDMECAVCKQSVADFKLVMGSSKGEKSISGSSPASPSGTHTKRVDDIPQAFESQSFSSSRSAFDHDGADSSIDGLESAFEFGLDFGELRASTPKMEQQIEYSNSFSQANVPDSRRDRRTGEDHVVLRIDNVPWVCLSCV